MDSVKLENLLGKLGELDTSDKTGLQVEGSGLLHECEKYESMSEGEQENLDGKMQALIFDVEETIREFETEKSNY